MTDQSRNDQADPHTLLDDGEPFAAIPTWILLHADLSGNAVRLYGILKMYARQTERAWPGREALGAHIGRSVDVVDRLVADLQRVGAVTVVRRWRDTASGETFTEPAEGRGSTSNMYRLHWQRGIPTAGERGPQKCGGGSRKNAAGGAAELRHEVHALEVHASESATMIEHAATTEYRAPVVDLQSPAAISWRLLGAYSKACRERRAPFAVDETSMRLRRILDRALVDGRSTNDLRRALADLAKRHLRLSPETLRIGLESAPVPAVVAYRDGEPVYECDWTPPPIDIGIHRAATDE